MGSGKSTVGRRLARDLQCHYLDNDEVIADLAGKTTVDLAAAGGTLLHTWESRYVHHLQALSAPFVAGIPASCADRCEELRILRRTGTLIYLRCEPATLAARVVSDPPRPWLSGDVRAVIDTMFVLRDGPLQRACAIVVDGSQSIDRIASSIAQFARDGSYNQPSNTP